MLLYAITDRRLLATSEPERARKLVQLAAAWSASGVDYIQLRERDLSPLDLTTLAGKMVRAIRENRGNTSLLINAGAPGELSTILSATVEAGARGIHLPGSLSPEKLAEAIQTIRHRWGSGESQQNDGTLLSHPTLISVACHSIAEVRAARAAGASLALFAPVFEKPLADAPPIPGQGLRLLAEACQAGRQSAPYPELPVLALGGVTRENAMQCINAGASGVASIRLFMKSD